MGDLVLENIKSMLQEAHLHCDGWLENVSCHGAVRGSAGGIFLQIGLESIADGVHMTIEEFLNSLLLTKLCFAPLDFFRCANFLLSRQDTCMLSDKGFFSSQVYSYLRFKVATMVTNIQKAFHEESDLQNEHKFPFSSMDSCSSEQGALSCEVVIEESFSVAGSFIIHRKSFLKPKCRGRNGLEIGGSALVEPVVQPCLSVFAGMIQQCGIVSSNPSKKGVSRGSNQKRKRVDNPGPRNGSRKKASSSSKPKGQVQQECAGSSLKKKEANGTIYT